MIKSRLNLRNVAAIAACLASFSANNHLAAQNLTSEHTQWYVGVSAGASIFDNKEAMPNIIGLQGAYFFNQKYGAGLVARKCNTSFLNYSAGTSFNSRRDHVFLGASFFAHWGRSNAKLFFPTRIGLGVNQCTHFNGRTQKYTTYTEMGAHGSVGISIRPSKLVSFGVNAEWASAFEDMDSPELFGVNLGISFHF